MTITTKKPRDVNIATEPPHITCELCNERFADEETLDAHQRTELDRHQPSNRFLYMPKLDKCYSKEALWAQGWRSTKHSKKLWIWTKPPMPKKRAHKINEDETYQCLLCQKHFKDATPFLAHFVHRFLEIERCLDSDELRALDYEQSKAGVWRAAINTQLLPSQVNRLATVRQELAAYEAAESTKRELESLLSATVPELAGGYSGSPPNKEGESQPLESTSYERLSSELEPPKAASRLVAQVRLAKQRLSAAGVV